MRDASRKRLRHVVSLETLEPRHLMSADPPAEFHLDQLVEAPPLEMFGTLANAHNMTGVTDVRNDYGFTGVGQTVAVIDSGIAYDHTALGGGFGADYRVVGGWDFAENDANPYDDGTAGSHGTHVAGIVGSTHSVHSGVAPGVDLVALRVFNDAGEGNFTWVERALQWVHTNRYKFENPITAVNLSIGSTWNGTTVPNWSTLEDEFAQLEADGIFVAVAAGNAFTTYNTTGLSYPASSPHVVPVASVDDKGLLSSFSQRHDRVIAAPGRSITSTVPDYRGNKNGKADDYLNYSGTSMASPYVAGASVLVRQAMEFLGRDEIDQASINELFRSTAETIFDSVTNQNYLRLNLAKALDSLMPADAFGSDAASAKSLGTVIDTRTINGLIGKLSDLDYFQFVAGETGRVSITLDSPQGFRPKWNLDGGAGTVSGTSGEVFSFNVVAGQSYAFGLGTQTGIGYYSLSMGATELEVGLFDETFYLHNNADIERAVDAGIFQSGLEHYLRFGQQEGRNPSAVFDEAYYQSRYSDVRAALARGDFRSGFEHYTQRGQQEGRNPSGLFDERLYVARYADVRAAIARGEFSSGAEHFLKAGQFSGYTPSTRFSHSYYINRYSDVRGAIRSGEFASSFEHFVRVGRAAGRIGVAPVSTSTATAATPATTSTPSTAAYDDSLGFFGPGNSGSSESFLSQAMRGVAFVENVQPAGWNGVGASSVLDETAIALDPVEPLTLEADGVVDRWLTAENEPHELTTDADLSPPEDRDLLAEIDALFALLA